MRTEQITFTIPKHKKGLREELQRLKEENSVNMSAFIVSAIEEKLSRVSNLTSVDGWILEE